MEEENYEQLKNYNPISAGVYLPTPFVSFYQLAACELDYKLKEITKGDFIPLMRPNVLVLGPEGNSEEATVGWIQWLTYRYINASFWTNLPNIEPFFNKQRMYWLVNYSGAEKKKDNVMKSNPGGVDLVIATNEKLVNSVGINCLRPNGHMLYIAVYPFDEETKNIINENYKNFKSVEVLMPDFGYSDSFLLLTIAFLHKKEVVKPTKNKRDTLPEKIVDGINNAIKYYNSELENIKNTDIDKPNNFWNNFINIFNKWKL